MIWFEDLGIVDAGKGPQKKEAFVTFACLLGKKVENASLLITNMGKKKAGTKVVISF
jgi:hypothetical protein